MEADGFTGFHGELFLCKKETFGDAGDLDGLEAFLGVEGGLDGTSGCGFEPVGLFEVAEGIGDGGGVSRILPVRFQS